MTKRGSCLWWSSFAPGCKLPGASSYELGRPDMNLGFTWGYKMLAWYETFWGKRRLPEARGKRFDAAPIVLPGYSDSLPLANLFHHLVLRVFFQRKAQRPPKMCDITVIGPCGLWGWCFGSLTPPIFLQTAPCLFCHLFFAGGCGLLEHLAWFLGFLLFLLPRFLVSWKFG